VSRFVKIRANDGSGTWGQEGPEESTCGTVQGSWGGQAELLEGDRCSCKGHGQEREFG
jgi:hypothetical protein